MRHKKKVYCLSLTAAALLLGYMAIPGTPSSIQAQQTIQGIEKIAALEQSDPAAIEKEILAMEAQETEASSGTEAPKQAESSDGSRTPETAVPPESGQDPGQTAPADHAPFPGETAPAENREDAGESQPTETAASRVDREMKALFTGTVIMGDSITEGLLDYEILDKEIVIAKKGMTAGAASDEIQTAITLSPKAVFIAIGMNDLEYYRGDGGRYKKAYEARIQELRDALPDVPIYINCILPIQQKAIDKKPVYGNVDAFNQELQDMCNELGLTYIDNAGLLDGLENIYQKDGIHVKKPYYHLWLEHMAETAGLERSGDGPTD